MNTYNQTPLHYISTPDQMLVHTYLPVFVVLVCVSICMASVHPVGVIWGVFLPLHLLCLVVVVVGLI